jgi:hypothetical protein
MKRCPQCGAEYDDYVQYCFVDGAELVVGASSTPKPAPIRPSTPLPAPVAAPGGIPAASTRSPRAAPRPPPPPDPRSSPLWVILVFLLLGVALLAFGGVVVALLFFGSQGAGDETVATPAPAPTQPDRGTMPPIQLPKPVPSPSPASVVLVRFESDPSGAQVWEQDQYLCQTPCPIDQPEYAPLPREFVLRLDGHVDTPHRMTDTDTQRVELKPIPKPPPTSRPRPSGNEDIIIKR